MGEKGKQGSGAGVTYEQVLDTLPKLTSGQRKELLVRLQALLPQVRDAACVLKEHYSIIETAFKAHGYRVPPFFSFQRSRAYKTMREGLDLTLEFIKKHLLPKTKTQRLASVRLLIELCLSRRQELGEDVTMTKLAGDLKQIEVVVDTMFPGYIQSGMLRVLLQRKGGVCRL